MKTHKDLEVWKEGVDLVVAIYKLTSYFPKEEQFGLTSQMRRAAVSVPSNIAEGAARQSKKEFIKYLYIALGSISELETQYLISQKLNYSGPIDLGEPITRIRQKLLNFIKHLKSKNIKPASHLPRSS